MKLTHATVERDWRDVRDDLRQRHHERRFRYPAKEEPWEVSCASGVNAPRGKADVPERPAEKR